MSLLHRFFCQSHEEGLQRRGLIYQHRLGMGQVATLNRRCLTLPRFDVHP